MIVYFSFGRVPPEMFCFIPDEEHVVQMDYDKENSEMCMEHKRLAVYDDAASMIIAFPGINYLSLNSDPIRWRKTDITIGI
jgi:hypothetical protein